MGSLAPHTCAWAVVAPRTARHEEGDAAYAESVCAIEELKFYKDNVDPEDMTPLKKPTTEHDPLLKFKSVDDTKLVDFVPGNSSKKFSISANMDPK